MLAEKSPLRIVKPPGVRVTIDEEWIVEKDMTYEEEELLEQTGRETQTFVIIGGTQHLLIQMYIRFNILK